MYLHKRVFVSVSIIFLFFSCATSPGQNKRELNRSDIVGKWVIQKIDLITNPSLLMPSDTMDLIKLFGAEIWSYGEGKYFEFKENGLLRTDMLINDTTLSREMAELAKMVNKFKFRYKFDSDLTVITYFEDEERYKSPVKVLSLTQDQMIWDIGGLYKVTLVKVEK